MVKKFIVLQKKSHACFKPLNEEAHDISKCPFVTLNGTEMVQATPLRRTLSSFP